MGMTETEMCECGEDVESVKHYILDCRFYLNIRTNMLQKLSNIKVPPTLQNLLGGGDFDVARQNLIVDILADYIRDTHKMKKI